MRVPRAEEPKNILRKYPNACTNVSQPVMELSAGEKKPSAVLKDKGVKEREKEEEEFNDTYGSVLQFVVIHLSDTRVQRRSTIKSYKHDTVDTWSR